MGILYLIPFLLLTSLSSYALEFKDSIFPELATSGRALAMGNAYICKVDDSSAVFYNPAGLGTVRFPHIHISNFHLEMNKGWMNTATGGTVTDAANSSMKAYNIEGLRQLSKNNQGRMSYGRIHALPNITMRHFSTGFLFSKQIKAEYATAQDGGKFEYADRLDMGPYAALNFSLFGGVLKFGGTAILLRRSELVDKGDINTELTSPNYDKGSSIQGTVGGKLTLPIAMLPTFAAVLHNAGATDFMKEGTTKPDKIKQTFDVGFSLTPQIGNQTRVHLEANYKDVGRSYVMSQIRRLQLGLELDFSRTMFVRGGYGDGFGSFGLGIKSRRLEFDLTAYALDHSRAGLRAKEDRHFSMTISSGF